MSVARAGFVDEGAWTLAWFSDVLQDPLYREGLVNSVILASAVTLLTIVISLPLVLLAETYNFAGKRIWLALVQVPLILPPFVGAIGLKGMLSRNGGINALLAHFNLVDPANPIDWLTNPMISCIVLEALYLYPITFLNLQAAYANINPALLEASDNLGAGSIRRLFRVTLPLMRPGVFAGSTIVFIWALTELGTPLMVGFRRVTAVQVFDELQTTNPQGDTYALVVLLLALSAGLYVCGKLVLGRSPGAMVGRATVPEPPRRLTTSGTLLATIPFALVFLCAATPHIGVLLGSVTKTGMLELAPAKLTLEHHAELAKGLVDPGSGAHGLAGLSIVNSLKYSLAATAIDLVLGFAIAYLIVRRRSRLSVVLDSLAMLPLAVPGLVMAFGYFALTQGNTPLSFLNPLTHSPMPLLVIAYSVRRLPFIVRSCAAGLEQTADALEEAAMNLGAGTPRVLRKVTIPLLAPNFIAGGLLVFSRSMLEVSDSLILAFDRETYPMTKAIWSLASIPQAGLESASALGVWGMLLLVVTIAGASLALGKRLGALFRI